MSNNPNKPKYKNNSKKYIPIEKKVLSHKEVKVKSRYYDMLAKEKKPDIIPKDLRENSINKKKKANPFKKYREEYIKKMEEKKQKQLEYQERMKEIKLRAKEKQQKSILLRQKTKKGQPVMKNLINHYLEKIEKDIGTSTTNNDD